LTFFFEDGSKVFSEKNVSEVEAYTPTKKNPIFSKKTELFFLKIGKTQEKLK